MDARTVFDDLALTLGQTAPPAQTRPRILSEINATLQILAGAPAAFRSEDISITASGSTASTVLDGAVISIDRHLRHSDGEGLVEIPTRGMYENYGALYGGQSDRTNTEAKPEAYFVEGKKAAAAEEGSDFTELEVFWWPTPDTNYTITAKGRKRPAEITMSDLDGTQQILELTAITATPPVDDSMLTIYGSRGTSVVWFRSGSEPSWKLSGAMAVNEYSYANTATWASEATGAAVLIAAIRKFYPVYQIQDTDEVWVHLGAAPYTDASTTGTPNFTTATNTAGVEPTAIPVTHGFIESVFMPIARFRLASFYRHFTDDQKIAVYAQQAQAALRQVGLDPDMASYNINPQGRREEAVQGA